MTSTYIRHLCRFATPALKKHARKFSQVVFSAPKHFPQTGNLCSRYFCQKPVDILDEIGDDDFESHEQTSNYKDVDFESIAQGDPEKLKTLKRIQLEIDVIAQEGGRVPEKLSSHNWLELLSFTSRHRRMKHLSFLHTNEQKKIMKKRKQILVQTELAEFRKSREPRVPLSTDAPVEYGLLKTTLFHRIYEPDMKKFYHYRLLQASMFGPHIIIDCGFENYMTEIEMSACASDLLRTWSENRDHFYPYDIIFCNMLKSSKLYSRLSNLLPPLATDPAFPFNFTDKHYLDLYPKEQLIYLTPHCKEEMESFDGNSIYIIGGLCDKSKDSAVTLAKAKKEGIRRAKFPLERYMKWNFGKKSLSIPECVRIMNDLKDGKSWDFALRHLKRKQMSRRCDLLDDGVVEETNRKTGEHFVKLKRQKDVYNVLLKKKGKKWK